MDGACGAELGPQRVTVPGVIGTANARLRLIFGGAGLELSSVAQMQMPGDSGRTGVGAEPSGEC